MTEEVSDVEYLIDEDLGDNGGTFRARNVDELEAWVKREQEFWAWLDESEIATANHVKNVANHVTTILKQLMAITNQLRQGGDRAAYTKQFSDTLDQRYRRQTLLHSDTEKASFIDRLRQEEGLVEAASALGKCISMPLDLNDYRQFHGAVALVVFLEGATPKTTPAVRRSLKNLADKYRDRYQSDTHSADALLDRLNDLVNEHDTLKERSVESMAQAVRLARNQAQQQREQTTEQLQDLEKRYNEKLALDAPVNYWKRKRLKHRWLAVGFLAVFSTYVWVASSYSLILVDEIGGWDLEFWRSASIGLSALFLVVVGILVALGRVLLRLGLSQLHLGNDADERVTMVNTYLALREGGHAKEDHMHVVLERLFTPATDGLVKDDLGPVTTADALKSVVTRK